jgi:hypothetical protein
MKRIALELLKVAKLLAADASPLDGMSKNKASKFVNNILDKHTHGIFSDDYWSPVKRMFEDMKKAGIEGVVTKADYVKNDAGIPASKQWKFEIEFMNDRGKPTTLYGNITAAGAGSVQDPLDKYDVVAYVS